MCVCVCVCVCACVCGCVGVSVWVCVCVCKLYDTMVGERGLKLSGEESVHVSKVCMIFSFGGLVLLLLAVHTT